MEALRRQAEANLRELSSSSTPRSLWETPRSEPAAAAPKAFQASSNDIEWQVSQLRSCVELLEKKLEDKLQSFSFASDKRLQAREDQLRGGVGSALQASADVMYEQLSRLVEHRIQDWGFDQQAQRTSLDEVLASIKRVEADYTTLESRVLHLTPTDELAQRLREVDRAQQRLEERLSSQEGRLLERCNTLETRTVALQDAMNRRCDALEQRMLESASDREKAAEMLLKRLPEAHAIQELQDNLQAAICDKELYQRRLTATETKLSKLGGLDARISFVETHTAQQLEEQAQARLGLAERLEEKDRAQRQRFEERLAGQDRRLLERCMQLEISMEACREAMDMRCEAVEQRIWEGGKDRGEVAKISASKIHLIETRAAQQLDKQDQASSGLDERLSELEVALNRLPTAQLFQELQEDLHTAIRDQQVQQQRLTAAEVKLCELAVLKSRLDFVEKQTLASSGSGEMVPKLWQKLKDCERLSDSQQELQQHLARRLDEAEARLNLNSARVEKDVAEQLTALAPKIQENVATLLEESKRQQLQHVSEELGAEAKMQRSRMDALELQLTEVQSSMQQAVHELKLGVDSIRSQGKPKTSRLKGKHAAPESDQRREIQLSMEPHQVRLLSDLHEHVAMRCIRAEIMRAIEPCSSSC